MITVKIKDKLNESLEYNGAATDFLDELNEYPDDEIKVDFSGIIFMSRSFAQEYYGKKSISEKDIEDINGPEDVQLMLNIAENNLKRRLG